MPAPTSLREVRQTRPPGPWVLALAVLAVSLGATLVAWLTALHNQKLRDQDRLDRYVTQTRLHLANRLGRWEDLTRTVRGFFADGTPPSPQEWRAFVDSLDLPARHPDLVDLAFIREVEGPGLERYLRAHPHLAGRLDTSAPPPGRSRLIAELCQPGGGAILVPGRDAGVIKALYDAAQRTATEDRPGLSDMFLIGPVESPRKAMACLVPVHLRDGVGAPRGWIVATLLTQPFLANMLEGQDAGLSLEVADAASPTPIFTSSDGTSGRQLVALHALQAGGHTWQLRYALQPSFYRHPTRRLPLTLLLGGVVVSLCLAAGVWSLAGTRLRALELAQGMDASLYEAVQRNASHRAHTPLAVIETDATFRIQAWNPAAERIFGFTQAEALGRDPLELLPPGQGTEAVDVRRNLLAADSGICTTLEHTTAGGQGILCDWYITALRDEGGRFIGAIFQADDITQRRQAESALQQAQKLESLGVLAGGIAHDFNNLLTAILGNAEVAQGLVRDHPVLQAALQRIEATTQRGSDLARQLLAYAGKAHFAIQPIDLNTIILEMGDLLAVSISKKVSISTFLQPDLPAVEADSAQFQQVVMNLVINASEAIGDHPGTVILRTRAVTCSRADLSADFPGQVLVPGTYVRLDVEDDGCGMDAETIGRIFDPFFTTKFTGRGLGLSAMLGIVRGHHAGLRVQSRPGKGTTFTLLFPASGAALPAALPPTEADQPSSGTVLVVDDESIIRDLARGALQGLGFRVLEARDGLEAVEFFEAGLETVDLVLLDMTMPRMGGAEAFRRIRALSPGTRVLLTSGYTQKESLESLVDLPPDGFLQKPFRIRELAGKVREVLLRR
ncbi:MAG: response regulator [Holophagaceae bacterium]